MSQAFEPMPAPDQNLPQPVARNAVRTAPKKRLGIGTVVSVLLLAAATAWTINMIRSKPASPAGTNGAAAFPVPVVAGTVQQRDVPIYLDGLGTVQALNTVTVRPRLDGELTKVSFVEGQDVKVGDLLAQIDDAPFKTQLQQSEAKKAQDEALLANARLDLDRYLDLSKRNVIAPQQYDTQKALVIQLEAAVKADQAAIESAKVQLAYTTITSPLVGRTGIRLVDQGNIVHPGDARGLVVITQLQPISVVFTLPAQSLAEIQSQKAHGEPLQVLAVDRDNKTVIDTGTLTVIDNQIDTTTGTLLLKATFPNRDLKLWPGQFMNTRLLVTVRKRGTVVPASVVQRGPSGAFAYVIKDDLSVIMRPVEVARIEQDQALIDKGLEPGERVVVDGQYKLQPGSKVKVQDASSPESKIGKPQATK
jgi:multidrug efflux system membrane fusion protein